MSVLTYAQSTLSAVLFPIIFVCDVVEEEIHDENIIAMETVAMISSVMAKNAETPFMN